LRLPGCENSPKEKKKIVSLSLQRKNKTLNSIKSAEKTTKCPCNSLDSACMH
jgi:hypothetical protein